MRLLSLCCSREGTQMDHHIGTKISEELCKIAQVILFL